jgi:hypothetical protein
MSKISLLSNFIFRGASLLFELYIIISPGVPEFNAVYLGLNDIGRLFPNTLFNKFLY